MHIHIASNKKELGKQAARLGADLIQQSIDRQGAANIILATGASQFQMLESLVQEDIDWSKISGFHLDEYLDLPMEHPASFRKYLKERFVDQVRLEKFHFINGQSDPDTECKRLGNLITKYPIDVAFVGIGENAHLAFNDPPADFETDHPYIVVNLDQACRMQQLNEGWFNSLSEVPLKAISMSVKQILKSTHVICTVPDKRKAVAVSHSIEGEITPEVPASILQIHPHVQMFLDRESASLLSKESLS